MKRLGGRNARYGWRTGFSLVELLFVVAISSTVMGIAAMLLVLVVRADSSQRRHLADVTNWSRFQEQFRRDVAGSQHAEPIADPADMNQLGIRLTDSRKQTIEYHWRASSQRMERTAERADDDQPEGTVARESYRLPAETQLTMRIVGDVPRRFVELSMTPVDPSGNRVERRQVKIKSLLGRDSQGEAGP